MKLMRVGPKGAEKPAMLDASGTIRDLSSHIAEIDGLALSDEGLAALAALDPASLPKVDAAVRVGACVGNISKCISVGLNYSDHAAETNSPIPSEPILFGKAVTAICGPNDDVEKPRASSKLDWEVELCVVIGKRAKYVSEAEAMDHVAGYAVFNDVSERDFQFRDGGQWLKGKSHDTFGPLGPWLVTKDEIPEPGNLKMKLTVNGKTMQDGSTSTLIFSVPHVVHYISQFITLEPGDIIPTGTPPGVAAGMKPPPWLNVGDVMELEIESLGAQRQMIAAA